MSAQRVRESGAALLPTALFLYLQLPPNFFSFALSAPHPHVAVSMNFFFFFGLFFPFLSGFQWQCRVMRESRRRRRRRQQNRREKENRAEKRRDEKRFELNWVDIAVVELHYLALRHHLAFTASNILQQPLCKTHPG